MELNKARAIVALAIENETLEGDLPVGDANVISEAEGLVENAITAWGKNIRGPEVEALLMLDANFDDMSAEEQEAASAKYVEPTPDETPAEEPADDGSNPFAKKKESAQPDPEPEPESTDDQPTGERVAPTAASIEAAKEAILEAAKDGDPDDDDYYDPEGDTPPFEDYDKVKVAEFKTAFANEWDAEQIAVVQLYEASHKGRPGIVNWTPDKASAPKSDDPPAEEPKDEPTGGEGGTSTRNDEAATETKAHGGTFKVTWDVGSSSMEVTQSGKHAAVGIVLDALEHGATSVTIAVE
jgi:hypothetical protein